MKKTTILAVVALLLTACEKQNIETNKQLVTFSVQGDFSAPAFTRSMMADGKEMTDLLIYDYMGDNIVQTIHQTKSDANWGNPTIALELGEHRIYFVASRGSDLSISNTIVSWQKPSDTFWATKTINVQGGTSTTQNITLSRVSTRLRLLITDLVPDNIATLEVKPSQWWYSLDYISGQSLNSSNACFTINVPSTYAGTEGELIASILGMSDTDEWMTDVTITAKNADGEILGTATIHDAPFLRNRCTEYSGRLFSSASGMSMSLDDTWLSSYQDTW